MFNCLNSKQFCICGTGKSNGQVEKHMQQVEQEKFGVKVQSHGTISCLIILFNRLWQKHFNISWFPISI
jgi:hypothetical protein